MTSPITRRTMLAAGGAAILASASIKRADATDFIPAFEFQDWQYQSYLLLPTNEGLSANPGNDVTAKKWASGKLTLSDSPAGGASGYLEFPGGIKLRINVTGEPGKDGAPATFEATGIGTEGVVKGAEYHLTGWAIPGKDGKVQEVRGAVRAARGPDAAPNTELGRMPVGTVGAFVIAKPK
ncbi:MAG: hypothetical protein M3552_01860 [Planctomycetota bacterium]|nr:hypothetical protein [Planctomycetota bacterium]